MSERVEGKKTDPRGVRQLSSARHEDKTQLGNAVTTLRSLHVNQSSASFDARDFLRASCLPSCM
jgi:hypothetical protein